MKEKHKKMVNWIFQDGEREKQAFGERPGEDLDGRERRTSWSFNLGFGLENID